MAGWSADLAAQSESLLAHERVLDLRTGMLTRSLRWRAGPRRGSALAAAGRAAPTVDRAGDACRSRRSTACRGGRLRGARSPRRPPTRRTGGNGGLAPIHALAARAAAESEFTSLFVSSARWRCWSTAWSLLRQPGSRLARRPLRPRLGGLRDRRRGRARSLRRAAPPDDGLRPAATPRPPCSRRRGSCRNCPRS